MLVFPRFSDLSLDVFIYIDVYIYIYISVQHFSLFDISFRSCHRQTSLCAVYWKKEKAVIHNNIIIWNNKMFFFIKSVTFIKHENFIDLFFLNLKYTYFSLLIDLEKIMKQRDRNLSRVYNLQFQNNRPTSRYNQIAHTNICSKQREKRDPPSRRSSRIVSHVLFIEEGTSVGIQASTGSDRIP